MNLKKTIVVGLLASMFFLPAVAKLNLPTKTLGSDKYYYYEVQKNQSIYDVARIMGVTKEDILKYNPSARNGIAQKQLIFLPVKEFENTSAQSATKKVNVANLNNTVVHTVKTGESFYGIAKMYNLKTDELEAANPGVDKDLKVGEQLLIPTKPTVTGDYLFHTVKSGETLYSLAKEYNTTVESLLKLNPGINSSNLKVNEVVKVAPNTTKDITVTQNIQQVIAYTAVDGDTYQSVAAAHGVDANALMKANPQVKKLKKGKTIYIPVTSTDNRVVNSSTLTLEQIENGYKDKLESVIADVHRNKTSDTIDITMFLPLQLGMSKKDPQAKNYEEFYNGFLLALDSLGTRINRPMNLNVYDTKKSKAVTDSLLRLSPVAKSDIIIAPTEAEQQKQIFTFGQNNNIDVLNCFDATNDNYITNDRVLQVNIPSTYLNASVNNLIDTQFKDYVLLFLEDARDGAKLKDIYKEILKNAEQSHHQRKTIKVTEELTAKAITREMEPGSSYLVIPSNGNESLLNLFEGALKEAKATRVDCDLALLGHPEYTMYFKKHKENFMSIDTYIYSRFFLPDNSDVAAVNNRYVNTFGSKPTNSTPNMSIFGFDVAMFLVNAYLNNHDLGTKDAAYKGIQTDFNFERVNNWSGNVNKSVRLIHLTPKSQLIISDLND